MTPQLTDIVRVCKKLDGACQYSYELKLNCSSIIWISRHLFFGIKNYCDLKIYAFFKTTKTAGSAWGLVTNLWHTQLCNNISARLAKLHVLYMFQTVPEIPFPSPSLASSLFYNNFVLKSLIKGHQKLEIQKWSPEQTTDQTQAPSHWPVADTEVS